MKRFKRGRIRYGAIGGILAGAVILAIAAGPLFGQEPANVGGKKIVLGESIEIAVPDGWRRGTPSMEKDAEAFVLIYTGREFDPDKGEPHGLVQINPEIDEFEDGARLERYYQNVEKNLVKSGWTRGELTVRNRDTACYALEDSDSTTFCIQLAFGVRSLTAYVIVPRKGAGFPKYAIRLLEAVRLK